MRSLRVTVMSSYLIFGAIYTKKKEELSQTKTDDEVGVDGVAV